MQIAELTITLCDPLNPGFGYQMKIVNDHGITLLFTSRDPETGKDLLTLADALRVARGYETPPPSNVERLFLSQHPEIGAGEHDPTGAAS